MKTSSTAIGTAITLACFFILYACGGSDMPETADSGLDNENVFSISRLAEQQARQIAALPTSDTAVGAVTSSTYFCSSPAPLTQDTGNGSVTYTRDDVDPPGFSTGDTQTAQYDNCTQFGSTTTGTTTSSVVDAVGIPYATPPWSLAMSMSSDLTTTIAGNTVTMKSSYNFSDASDDGIIRTNSTSGSSETSNGQNTSSSTFSSTATVNMQTTEFTREINNSGNSAGNSRSLETLVPLTGTGFWVPDAGVIKTTQTTATNTIVRTITAIGNGLARVETDINGDGTVDTTIETSWWAAPLFGFF